MPLYSRTELESSQQKPINTNMVNHRRQKFLIDGYTKATLLWPMDIVNHHSQYQF